MQQKGVRPVTAHSPESEQEIYFHVSRYLSKKNSVANEEKLEKLQQNYLSLEQSRIKTKEKFFRIQQRKETELLQFQDQYLIQLREEAKKVFDNYERVQNQQERYVSNMLTMSAQKYGKEWQKPIVKKMEKIVTLPKSRLCSAKYSRPKFFEGEIPGNLKKNNPTLNFLLQLSPSKRKNMEILKRNLQDAVERAEKRQNQVQELVQSDELIKKLNFDYRKF